MYSADWVRVYGETTAETPLGPLVRISALLVRRSTKDYNVTRFVRSLK